MYSRNGFVFDDIAAVEISECVAVSRKGMLLGADVSGWKRRR